METIATILKLVFSFAFVIGIHEIGHALAAIMLGIKVHEVSIGIGPGITIKNVWKFGTLRFSPIVLVGYANIDSKELESKAFWKQCIVYVNGMIFNVLSAIIILASIGWPLLKATLFSFGVWLGGWFVFATKVTAENIGGSVAGPIGITGLLLGDRFWFMLAIIHLSVAMFNLLPIPPLDGGRIAFGGIIKAFPRVGPKIFQVVSIAGIIAILLLMLFVTCNDISRLQR